MSAEAQMIERREHVCYRLLGGDLPMLALEMHPAQLAAPRVTSRYSAIDIQPSINSELFSAHAAARIEVLLHPLVQIGKAGSVLVLEAVSTCDAGIEGMLCVV